jgi:predicted phosphodiesterase
VPYLLLSDLHSNEEATRAVLGSAGIDACQRVVVLGDLVGYGASPDQVVETVRKLNPVAAVRGNHDKVVAGIDSGEEFNRTAKEAARINRSLLSQGNLRFLEALPRGPLEVAGSFLIAHGTPLDEDEYLVDEWEAGFIFQEMEFSVCFFGHTHLPGAFVLREGKIDLLIPQGAETVLPLDSAARYLINPGSVGQPRDQDPRAAYALYDDDRRQVVFRRVEYPVSRARARIRAAGLPEILGERLERGV